MSLPFIIACIPFMLILIPFGMAWLSEVLL